LFVGNDNRIWATGGLDENLTFGTIDYVGAIDEGENKAYVLEMDSDLAPPCPYYTVPVPV
jgi:hypothetical protein